MAAFDFSAMSEDDIRQAIFDLQADKDIIKSQVDGAKKARAEGVACDRKWLNAAEGAGRVKGRQIAQLQAALGAKLKESRAKANEENMAIRASFNLRFMQMAREILPRALYEQVMSETLAAERGEG